MPPLVAAGIGVFVDGGYSPGPRVAFAATGLGAGLVAFVACCEAASRALRQPLAFVLLALAVLGALSALWTLGSEERTLRWAAVTAGYLGVFVAAAAAGRTREGRIALAAGVALIAVASGVIGLVAALFHIRPYALEIGSGWRAAGPFEYPPALALLMVSALPMFIAAVGARSIALRLAGAAGAVLTAAVLVATESRTGLALGFAIVAYALYLRTRRRAAALVVVLLGIAAAGIAFGADADGPPSGFLHGREDIWRAAVESFLDRSLHGAGADAFLAASARHQDGAAILFAHNLPLELAAELGVVGLLLALALYWTSGRLLWDMRRRRAVWLFGPAVAAFLVSNLLDWPWHLAGAGAVWALAAGALAGAGRGYAEDVPAIVSKTPELEEIHEQAFHPVRRALRRRARGSRLR